MVFTQNWALTSGLRYDDYSDFGDTFNPRLALVWATTNSITTKFLYGRAFRAPTFNELFVTGNPVNLGDPELEPEVIDTYEIAYSQVVSEDMRFSANIYYYEIDGLISLTAIGGGARQWQNSNDRTGYGIELEGSMSIAPTLKLITNYSYQKSEDDDLNQDVGETPNHQAYARFEWQLNDSKISAQVNHVGEQKRAPEDSRTTDLESYTTIDLRLKKENILPNLDITIIAKNIADEDVFEPSLSPGVNIPNDYPLAGRSIFGELLYSF